MANQSYGAKTLADTYIRTNKNHPLDSEQYRSRSLLDNANSLIINHTLKGFGAWFDANPFNKTQYSESPDYYASRREYRGNEIKDTEDLCDEAYILYYEGWNMTEYWYEINKERFVEILPGLAEEFGVKILCPFTAPKNDYSYGSLDIAKEEIYWGNTAILSEEDWDKCYDNDDGIEQYVDLVANDTSYYVVDSIINVFEAIDESLEWWNGSEGVLETIESMLDNENFRLQAMLAVESINRVVDDKRSGWARRRQKIESIVSQYSTMFENFVV